MSKCLYHAWTKEEEKKLLQLAVSNGHKWKELLQELLQFKTIHVQAQIHSIRIFQENTHHS
ncbi:Homeobox-like_domain superfamily [Hexamita inflata]|uniref:Homeobox-like_domain superfamily n=1 Tax=Hexamita inflata TaxID=28002 RepID=A0ABP1GRT0_9EUKA